MCVSESSNKKKAAVWKKRGVEEDEKCLQNMWERDAECVNDTAYGTATRRQERSVQREERTSKGDI